MSLVTLVRTIITGRMILASVMATTIVTATMVTMGYAPNHGDIRTSEDTGTLDAFVSGLRLLYLIMSGVLLICIAASFFKGRQVLADEKTHSVESARRQRRWHTR